MIGNDIIDLKAASIENDWKRKGFLNKVFTDKEQDIILSDKDPSKMVWLLWSMKESAYKVYSKKYSYRFFAPKKLQCTLTSKTSGYVRINDEEYFTESLVTSKYIHTITSKRFDKIKSCSFTIGNSSYVSQHKESYDRLKAETSEELKLPIEEISIKKDKVGFPKLYHNHKQITTPFSISHHGNYGAYAIVY